MASDLNLIHPEMVPTFYLGTAIAMGAVGGLFSNSQAIQMIARTALLGAVSQTVRIWFGARNCIPFYNISPDKRYTIGKSDWIVRSSSPALQGVCHGILDVPFQTLAGLIFASVARIRYSKFSTTVNAKHLLRSLLLIDVLAVVTSQLAAWGCTGWMSDRDVHTSVPQTLRPGWKSNLIRRNIYHKCLRGSYAALIGIIAIQRLGWVKIL